MSRSRQRRCVGESIGQLTQGIADGVDALAYHQLAAVTQGDGLQAGGINFQHGDVVILLAAHQLGGVLGAIGKGDLNADGGVLCGVLNDVVVGDDVASWVSTKPEPLAAEVVVWPKMFTVVFTVMPTQEARLAA